MRHSLPVEENVITGATPAPAPRAMARSSVAICRPIAAPRGCGVNSRPHKGKPNGRIRTKSDAPDLAQEVYARMLRVSDTEAIRNPQLYLYTVASNPVKEHAVRQLRLATSAELDETSVAERLGGLPALDSQLEGSQMVERLGTVLAQLPVRWRTALILQHRYGLTYQEIAERMGVSSNMVKKYLAQGRNMVGAGTLPTFYRCGCAG